MLAFIDTFNTLVGIGIVILQIGIVVLLALHIGKKKVSSALKKWLDRYALPMAFGISLTSVIGSLVYSGVILFDPCVLCWWQRIFHFSGTIIMGLALWYGDYSIKKYIIPLASIGGLIALFHYVTNFFQIETGVCDALGTVSCNTSYVSQFGYITIPLMSLTVFVTVILLMTFIQKNK